MPLHSTGIAPYATSTTILGLIDRARDRGLPSPVTKEVLSKSGVPESLIPRTLQSLQLLELINDDGTWTQNLENLRRCAESELQSSLAEIIHSVYHDVFQYVDPEKDSATVLRDAFRTFTPHGQQDRMVSLFIGLCKRAGIISSEAAPKSQQRTKRTANVVLKKKPPQKDEASSKQFSASGLSAPLSGVLATLPSGGSGWSQHDRDRFLTAFIAMLDYCIPIREKELHVEVEENE